MVSVELDDYQLRMLQDLIVDRIYTGGDPYSMRAYLTLFFKFKKIKSEENSVNK